MMDMKYHPGPGLVQPMPMVQYADPWCRVGCGGEATGRWRADGRHHLERYCSAAAAAAAATAAAKYGGGGGDTTAMFGDKAAGVLNSVTVDCIQRYRSTSGYINYAQTPFIDVTGLYYSYLCTADVNKEMKQQQSW